MKQVRFIELDKSVKPNPKCINSVFYCKGIEKCLKPDYCKDKFDYGGLKVCTDKPKEENKK